MEAEQLTLTLPNDVHEDLWVGGALALAAWRKVPLRLVGLGGADGIGRDLHSLFRTASIATGGGFDAPIGATEAMFQPGEEGPEHIEVRVGRGRSIVPHLDLLLPIIAAQGRPRTLDVWGVTHGSGAMCVDQYAEVIPQLFGPEAHFSVRRRSFAVGGGWVRFEWDGTAGESDMFTTPGTVAGERLTLYVSGMPEKIVQTLIGELENAFGDRFAEPEVYRPKALAPSYGVSLCVQREGAPNLCFATQGRSHGRIKSIVQRFASNIEAFTNKGVAIPASLALRLLPLLVVRGGGMVHTSASSFFHRFDELAGHFWEGRVAVLEDGEACTLRVLA